MVSFRANIIDIDRIKANGGSFGNFVREAIAEKLEREKKIVQGSKWENFPEEEKIIALNIEISYLEHQIDQLKRHPEYLKTIEFNKKLKEFKKLALSPLRAVLYSFERMDYPTIKMKIEEVREHIPPQLMNLSLIHI